MTVATYDLLIAPAPPVVTYETAGSSPQLGRQEMARLNVGLGAMQYTTLGSPDVSFRRSALKSRSTLAYTAELSVVVPQSGTGEVPVSADAVTGVPAMFRAAQEIEFEDGMANPFSLGLMQLVAVEGKAAVKAIASELQHHERRPHLVAQTLRILGRIEDRTTHPERLWLLIEALDNPSAIVRDGALLGLASLDDPDALPHVKARWEREQGADIRSSFEQVVEQLEKR